MSTPLFVSDGYLAHVQFASHDKVGQVDFTDELHIIWASHILWKSILEFSQDATHLNFIRLNIICNKFDLGMLIFSLGLDTFLESKDYLEKLLCSIRFRS